jgi:hypothetical protein
MDELATITHELQAIDPEVLADVPPGALAQWQEIGAGLGHFNGMLAQVMSRAVLPRTIAVGEALNSLRNTHYKHHGDRLRFVAHAEALIGLKSRQAQKFEAFGKHRRLLQEYVEQHGLRPTSLLALEKALRLAKAQDRRTSHGGEPDQWVDGRLVGADAPKQIAAGDQAGEGAGAKGRHKGIQALEAAAANLWQWSSDEAVGSRPGLRERVEKVAQAVEVVLQQIQAAINPEAGVPGAELTQLDLVEAVACPMPVVITADPQAELADIPRNDEVQVPAVGAPSRRKRNPIGVVTKRADTPGKAYCRTAEGLALLEADIDRAGGHQALGEIYGVAKQSIHGLLQDRKRQVAKLQAKAEVMA